MTKPIVYVVHCIDTEGPLDETISATFGRLKEIFNLDLVASEENLGKIQRMELDLNGKELAVSKCFSKENLLYNRNWEMINRMLDEVMSKKFRNNFRDDFDNGWICSWHIMDHVGLKENPRHKDYGFGNVYNHYKNIIEGAKVEKDEINWHFHPVSILKNPLAAATSFTNNYPIINEIIARRIIDHKWFPVVNRPGFHSERQDANQFFENWMPFDYGNQAYEAEEDQPDLINGRFGDWRRAERSWRGYHPDHDDYQSIGSSKRKIFRCLNVGTRTRLLNHIHLDQAFEEAIKFGSSILAFADHDYRDIRPDILYVWNCLQKAKRKYPEVLVKFSGAHEAAKENINNGQDMEFEISADLKNGKLEIVVDKGKCFGSQPFLALKTIDGRYFHDNLDEKIKQKIWTYTFDAQTIPREIVKTIGVGSAGRHGNYAVATLNFPNRNEIIPIRQS